MKGAVVCGTVKEMVNNREMLRPSPCPPMVTLLSSGGDLGDRNLKGSIVRRPQSSGLGSCNLTLFSLSFSICKMRMNGEANRYQVVSMVGPEKNR